MLKKRLIACLLWRDGMLVQSKSFKHTNSVGNAYTAIDFFNTWSIDEIILLDVTREPNEREKFHRDLMELSARCFVPLSVGGWVNSVEEMRRLLSEGADKVVVNSGAFRNEAFIRDGAERFGKQCLVLSIDAKRVNGGHEVFIDRGRKGMGVSPVDWAKQAEEWGIGEIFLTSIDQDGSGNGYDLELIGNVAKAVNVPAALGIGNTALRESKKPMPMRFLLQTSSTTWSRAPRRRRMSSSRMGLISASPSFTMWGYRENPSTAWSEKGLIATLIVV